MNPYRAPYDSPGNVRDHLYALYRELIPEHHRDEFFAILDDDLPDTAEWILNALDKLDALLHPQQPIPPQLFKATGKLRREAVDAICSDQRKRMVMYEL